MAENIIAKIQALLIQAGHKDTPEELARTSAVIAARLFVEHECEIVKARYVEPEETYDPRDDIPDVPDVSARASVNFKEVTPFRLTDAKNIGACRKCGKPYNRGEVVAVAIDTARGVTHFRCRWFWTEGKA